MAFEFEAKVPTEIQVPTRRILLYNEQGNEESLHIEKNFLEERRDVAYAQMIEYQQTVNGTKTNEQSSSIFRWVA